MLGLELGRDQTDDCGEYRDEGGEHSSADDQDRVLEAVNPTAHFIDAAAELTDPFIQVVKP
ncbi:MAG TPA: hypothetical protein VF009_03950 [Solirubrobacterales bacterium]